MDLQSFIQSGLLEAYVLGQCTAEERALVERMAAEHATVRAELAAIEGTLETYATAHSVQPPDWMKSSILERIKQETQQEPPSTPDSGTSKGALRFFQIISFLLAAACSFLFFRQKDIGSEKEQLQIRNDSLLQVLAACQLEAAKIDPVAELICDPGTQRILVSDGKGINTLVYYNPRLKRMAYDPHSLPEPKPGTHYQFWAIVGGVPQSMGMKAGNMCESIHTVEQAVAFAISEEPNPEGNPTPTTVLAIGNAG